MPSVARLNDPITGTTSGEHSGHVDPHPPETITGNISGNCSTNVFTNNTPTAYVGSITDEYDSCCGMSNGTIAVGSSTVFVNNIPIARKGDDLNAHSGTGYILEGSPDVFAN